MVEEHLGALFIKGDVSELIANYQVISFKLLLQDTVVGN
jgi:hypothetical protein